MKSELDRLEDSGSQIARMFSFVVGSNMTPFSTTRITQVSNHSGLVEKNKKTRKLHTLLHEVRTKT